MNRVRRRTYGATLVEVALAIGIAGVFLAVFVPTFVRELRVRKLDEPVEMLAAMEARVVAHYAESKSARGCLPPASGPVPATPHAQPFTADFSDANPAAMGFRIIGFAPNRPLRFRYSMTPSTEACPAPVGARIELVAEGNLDQDGQHSRFTRALVVDAHRELRALAPLRVERATE